MVEGANNKSVKREFVSIDRVQLALECAGDFRKKYGENILECSPLTDVDKVVGKITLDKT